jgi:hypothetical protein
MKNNQIKFKWVTRRSDIKIYQDDFAANGALLEQDTIHFEPPEKELQDYAKSSFDPLLVIAGVAAITYLVQKIISTIKEARHCGHVIDARGKELVFREQPGLKGGTYLVFTDQGVQKFDLTNSLGIDDLLKLIKH